MPQMVKICVFLNLNYIYPYIQMRYMDYEQLEALGLNRTEAQIYYVLVSEGACTAKDVSGTLGIPYGKV
jgi:DNA-binding MarR family transcriptional regulator